MEEKKVELTDKMKGMMDTIEKMTVMELADLVKALEEKFGVSAAAAVAVAAPGAAAGAAARADAAGNRGDRRYLLHRGPAQRADVVRVDDHWRPGEGQEPEPGRARSMAGRELALVDLVHRDGPEDGFPPAFQVFADPV